MKASSIPVVPGKPLLGNLSDIKKDFLGFMKGAFDDYGDVVEFHIGPSKVYLISNAELVEPTLIKNHEIFTKPFEFDKPRGLALFLGNGLVLSKGELWKRQRRMMQPMFNRSHIAAMAEEMARQGEEMTQSLLAEGGARVVDLVKIMSDVTSRIITSTMFSSDAGELQHRLADDIHMLALFSQNNFFHPMPVPLWVPTRKNREFKASKNFLTRAIKDMIDERRNSENRHGDLLDVLIESRDEETGETMSTQQVIDECLTMFSAGHETTATALTWALYLLSSNEKVQQRLQAEVDGVLQGRTPGSDDMEHLPYTRAVLEETMRLYPPIVTLLRGVEQDIDVGGYTLKKGGYIIVNAFNLHHNPKYWDEPEQFRPERFLDGNKKNMTRHSYIPFGIGQRVCIGNHFAMMEATILLAQITQQMSFRYIGEAPAVPKLAISLRPAEGMPMQIEPRATFDGIKVSRSA